MTQEIWTGDSLELAEKLPEGINCVVTDPPYGVAFKSFRAVTPQGKRWVRPIENDATLDGALALFGAVMDTVLPKTTADADLYVFTKWDYYEPWADAVRQLERHGFIYKMMLVWDKGIPGMGDIDGNWGCGHELILYAKKGRRDIPYRRSSIIAVDKVHPTHLIHPTEKPVALIEKLLEMSSSPGDLIVDPFAGSGSTIVAAQRQGRNAIGIELDEMYSKLARRRLEQPVMF